jgi:hypothetical protein
VLNLHAVATQINGFAKSAGNTDRKLCTCQVDCAFGGVANNIATDAHMEHDANSQPGSLDAWQDNHAYLDSMLVVVLRED